jgi:raffinose/stachyose/melibiose transport system permease protein
MNRLLSSFLPPSVVRKRSALANYAVLVLLAVYSFAPLAALAINSLKSNAEIASNPFGLPQAFVWDNYQKAWVIGNFGITLLNSTYLVLVSVTGLLIISFLAAYGLARYTPRGNSLFISYLLVGSSIPAQLHILPLYIFLSRSGLLDNLTILALINIARQAPFGAFLLRAFLLQTPNEFEEAARIDGASEFQVLSKILVPLCIPVIFTVALVAGLRIWNEFFYAVTLIQDPLLKPVSTSLYAFQVNYYTEWGPVNAGSIMTVLPIILLFILLQRSFVEGLTQGGLKG